MSTLPTDIATWLASSDDYEAGLTLLEAIGCSSFLLTLLRRGENAYNRTKLTQLLTDYQPTAEQSAVQQLTPGHASPAPTTNPGGAAKKTEESSAASPAIDGVKALEIQKSQLFDERTELKARIRATIDDHSDEAVDRRRPWALRIKAIGRALDELYSQLHFFEQHGYLPLSADPAVEIDDRAALLNARSYVSRYRKKLKDDSLTDAQRAAAQQLLDQYTLEKDRLEQKLNPTTVS